MVWVEGFDVYPEVHLQITGTHGQLVRQFLAAYKPTRPHKCARPCVDGLVDPMQTSPLKKPSGGQLWS